MPVTFFFPVASPVSKTFAYHALVLRAHYVICLESDLSIIFDASYAWQVRLEMLSAVLCEVWLLDFQFISTVFVTIELLSEGGLQS